MGRDHSENLRVCERIILEWIETGLKVVTDYIWLRIWTVAGSCEHGNEYSVSIKAGNFMTSLATVSFSRRTLPHVFSQSVSQSVNWSVCL